MEKIYSQILKKYTSKNTFAVLLFGSVIHGSADKFSDIDIYVILNKASRVSRRTVIIDGQRVEILFNTVDEIESYLRNEHRSFNVNVSQMLSESMVLYTKDDAGVKKLINVAKKNCLSKPKISENELMMHCYSVQDYWNKAQRAIIKRDMVTLGLTSNLIISNIVDLFLKTNGLHLVT